jgi:hypothetical protein
VDKRKKRKTDDLSVKYPSLLLTGFAWSRNSCAFDAVITVFMQIFFEFFHSVKLAVTGLPLFGHLSDNALKNSVSLDENTFVPQSYKRGLIAILDQYGKKSL